MSGTGRRLAVAATIVLAAWGCKKDEPRPKGSGFASVDDGGAPVVFVDDVPGRNFVFSDESEPNDELAAAGPLELGKGVRGVLSGQEDVDVYRIEVAEAGVLSAQLSGIEDVDLMLDVRGPGEKVLAHSDRGPAETPEGVPNLGVDPGVYYLVVSEYVKKRRKEARAGASPTYELTAEVRSPEEDVEREPNDDDDGAVALPMERVQRGYLGWHDDVDVWRVSLEGFGNYYTVDLDLAGVPGVTPTMSIADETGTPVLSRTAGKGEGIVVRNLVPMQTGAPKSYLVRLSGKRSNPREPYQLELRSRLLDVDEEIEPNDRIGDAMSLVTDGAADAGQGKRIGYLTAGDVDHYQLPAAPEPRVFSVTVEPPADVDVELVCSVIGGEVLGTAAAGGPGVKEQLIGVLVPAGKTVALQVRGAGSASPRQDTYDLRWSVDRDVGRATPSDPMPKLEPAPDDPGEALGYD